MANTVYSSLFILNDDLRRIRSERILQSVFRLLLVSLVILNPQIMDAFAQENLEAKIESTERHRAEAYYEAGRSFADAGKWDEAIRKYDEAIAIFSAFRLSFLYRGLAFAEKKQHQHAIEDYNRYLAVEPTSYKGHYLRGTAYFNIGNNEAAIRDFSTAISIDANLYQAFYARGLVYEDSLRLIDALVDQYEARKRSIEDIDIDRAIRRLENRLFKMKDYG